VWWKTGLDVAPLPDNCFNVLYGFKIRGPGKGNDLVGAVVYLSFLSDDKEVLQRARKWAKQGPVMILGDFNTGAAINKRLVEALRVEVDKRAGNRGASTTKKGTRIDRVGCRPGERQIYSTTSPEGYDNRELSLPVCLLRRMGFNSRGDRIVMPLRAHATKLIDLGRQSAE
jgi:hypothetical protein